MTLSTSDKQIASLMFVSLVFTLAAGLGMVTSTGFDAVGFCEQFLVLFVFVFGVCVFA
eukprot:m.222777 g.222777  ORF g.222777 m.222777 type:complete len:58 (+) comp16098_c0_seq1:1606-1779(+)